MDQPPGAVKQDARVRAAVGHWAPRFVANGVPLTDFQEVTAACERWEDWCAAWSQRAALHESLGDASFAQGFRRSAAEHWTRAALCYHFGKFLFVNDPVQMKAAHEKAVACRARALPYASPPGERVAIPYEGRHLYGILRKPAGVAKPPVVIMCMGLDSAKEETDAYEVPFLQRGMATLAFDGPGQGEGEYEFSIRGDYEVPVRAVVDYAVSRADLDAARIGIWGVSLGGYYAPRAAAYEKRIRACIALSGPYVWSDDWDMLTDLTREAFRVRSRCRTQNEARAFARQLTLAEAAPNITCPLYIVAGKLDRIVPWQDGEKLARAAKGPVVFNLIEDGNHVANNRGYAWRPQSADWMAQQLGLAKA